MDQIVKLVKSGKVQDGSTITTKGIIRVEDGGNNIFVESMHDLVLINGYNLSDLISGSAPSSLSSSSSVVSAAGQSDDSCLSGDYQDLLKRYEEEVQRNKQADKHIQELQAELIATKHKSEAIISDHQRDLVQLNMDKNIEFLDIELQLQESQTKLAAALKDLKMEKSQHSVDADKLKAVVHVEEMMDKDRALKDQMHTEEISRLCAELQRVEAELQASRDVQGQDKDSVNKRGKLKRLLSFRKEAPVASGPDM
eukprot:TRINITY_DN339_c0_g1_i1.p1 TRINITY_DN339_c0_g1~~TRINITY_DN339_c0_g1_i1.p1  ORF type:complete len:254 (-),score=70.88 TRINITY_DN339_c0_g1_i1:38-799(-)